MSITYARSFRESVGEGLTARFKLDANGGPLYEKDEEGTKHYFIELRLHSPRAQEIDKVSYLLGETYYDPIRNSKDRDNDFCEEITSYGNYPIKVKVQIGSHLYVQESWLSELLEAGYAAGGANEVIRQALRDIKGN